MTLEELEKKLFELDDLRSELNKLDDLRMELNKHIAELKEQDEEKPEPPHPRPYPERHQMYFYVNSMGNVNETNWLSDRSDLGAHEIGNVFFGETAAEFTVERLKVLAEMQEWAGSWDDEFNLRYNETSGVEIFTQSLPEKSYGEMRFATKEDAINCIKTVGEDRIKKYYFMIPEDEADDD